MGQGDDDGKVWLVSLVDMRDGGQERLVTRGKGCLCCYIFGSLPLVVSSMDEENKERRLKESLRVGHSMSPRKILFTRELMTFKDTA